MSYGNIKDITAEQFSEMHIVRKMTLKELDLWIEVSSYNDTDYLEKIWNKRRLVNNFIFFNNPLYIIEYFVKNGMTLRKC
jgi:hypothetical protein